MKSLISAFVSILLSAVSAGAVAQTPIGQIDQVVREGGAWRIKGWACQPSSGSPAQIDLYLNGQKAGASEFTSFHAEPAIISACGVASIAPNLLARFSLAYSGSLSGQAVSVSAKGVNGLVSSLSGSGEFRLPTSDLHPEAVLSQANRILLITAHEDDEIVFSPMLQRLCPTRTCKFVVATADRRSEYHPDAGEFLNSIARFPAAYDIGTFSITETGSTRTVSDAIQKWESEARGYGFASLNALVALFIDNFRPDVILTFDPRNGTTCHIDHRAVGKVVDDGVQAYYGPNFPDKSKVFFLTTKYVPGINEYGLPYYGLAPAVPKDADSVVYSAWDWAVPFYGGSGWSFLKSIMQLYPTQFLPPVVAALDNTPNLEATTAFRRRPANSTLPADSRYQFCPN